MFSFRGGSSRCRTESEAAPNGCCVFGFSIVRVFFSSTPSCFSCVWTFGEPRCVGTGCLMVAVHGFQFRCDRPGLGRISLDFGPFERRSECCGTVQIFFLNFINFKKISSYCPCFQCALQCAIIVRTLSFSLWVHHLSPTNSPPSLHCHFCRFGDLVSCEPNSLIGTTRQ